MVTNTGGLPLLFTGIDDKLKYGSTTQTLTLDWSSTSTTVFVGPKTNLFAYSNRLDEGSGWNEMNGSGQDWNDYYQWNIPLNEPYYYNADSGLGYGNVDSHFTTNGFGNTPSTYLGSGDSYSGRHAIGRNDNDPDAYLYRNVTLSGNTLSLIHI